MIKIQKSKPNRHKIYLLENCPSLINNREVLICNDYITDAVDIDTNSCAPKGASDDFKGLHGETGSFYKDDSLSINNIQGSFSIISAQKVI